MWQKKKRQIDEEERVINDIEKARERTMNRAVKLLAAKPRSVEELRQRLLEKAWTNAEIVDAVIAKLSEYKYLDDEQLARHTALSKLRRQPQGRRRLEFAMRDKKLADDTIAAAVAEAFEKMPEEKLIERAIAKRIRLKGCPKSREELKRFFDHLLRLGFSYSLVREKLKIADPDEIPSEFE
jgi:regulatory protein